MRQLLFRAMQIGIVASGALLTFGVVDRAVLGLVGGAFLGPLAAMMLAVTFAGVVGIGLAGLLWKR